MSALGEATGEEATLAIRRYRRSDREAYLALAGRVRDDAVSPVERFAWAYEENPYLDPVPVFVAERGGELVAAAGLWPLRVRLGDVTRIAVQPCEAVVDPAYRNRGLPALLVGEAVDAYRDAEPAFCIDFAEASGGDVRDRTEVGRLSTYYRVSDPGALLDLSEPLARIGRTAARGYAAACDRIAPSTDPLSVDRYESVPPETFAELYRRQVPAAIHAYRDEAFYRWRFRNPAWNYEAYVARRDGDPVAGAVVASRRPPEGEGRVVRVVDRVPLALDDRDAEASLLDAIVSARSDADAVAVHQDAFSHQMLSRFGFQRDDAVPVGGVGSPTAFGVRSLRADDPTPIEGYDPTDRTDWLVGFCERHSY
ncbi:MAG TPA: GNAT family N-acetyltransferase [Natronoarchaeum rubrum]|nr:GNAT family N-acetyltransferase [Natronoarchaeum rubrum]